MSGDRPLMLLPMDPRTHSGLTAAGAVTRLRTAWIDQAADVPLLGYLRLRQSDPQFCWYRFLDEKSFREQMGNIHALIFVCWLGRSNPFFHMLSISRAHVMAFGKP